MRTKAKRLGCLDVANAYADTSLEFDAGEEIRDLNFRSQRVRTPKDAVVCSRNFIGEYNDYNSEVLEELTNGLDVGVIIGRSGSVSMYFTGKSRDLREVESRARGLRNSGWGEPSEIDMVGDELAIWWD